MSNKTEAKKLMSQLRRQLKDLERTLAQLNKVPGVLAYVCFPYMGEYDQPCFEEICCLAEVTVHGSISTGDREDL